MRVGGAAHKAASGDDGGKWNTNPGVVLGESAVKKPGTGGTTAAHPTQQAAANEGLTESEALTEVCPPGRVEGSKEEKKAPGGGEKKVGGSAGGEGVGKSTGGIGLTAELGSSLGFQAGAIGEIARASVGDVGSRVPLKEQQPASPTVEIVMNLIKEHESDRKKEGKVKEKSRKARGTEIEDARMT